jgi:hypothetical protein
MKISNKLTEKHIGHEVSTKRAKPSSPHYGYYHCETCNKFVTWIPKEVYYGEKLTQRNNDIMWFGKYQGKPLSELPRKYLEWAILNIDKGVKRLIQEYERRGYLDEQSAQTNIH